MNGLLRRGMSAPMSGAPIMAHLGNILTQLREWTHYFEKRHLKPSMDKDNPTRFDDNYAIKEIDNIVKRLDIRKFIKDNSISALKAGEIDYIVRTLGTGSLNHSYRPYIKDNISIWDELGKLTYDKKEDLFTYNFREVIHIKKPNQKILIARKPYINSFHEANPQKITGITFARGDSSIGEGDNGIQHLHAVKILDDARGTVLYNEEITRGVGMFETTRKNLAPSLGIHREHSEFLKELERIHSDREIVPSLRNSSRSNSPTRSLLDSDRRDRLDTSTEGSNPFSLQLDSLSEENSRASSLLGDKPLINPNDTNNYMKKSLKPRSDSLEATDSLLRSLRVPSDPIEKPDSILSSTSVSSSRLSTRSSTPIPEMIE